MQDESREETSRVVEEATEKAGKTPEFLLEDSKRPREVLVLELKQVEEYVQEYAKHLLEIERLSALLDDEKARAKALGESTIPGFLQQSGVSEVRLSNGTKVIVKEDVSVSVPAEKRGKFFEFLRDRKEEDIVKLMVQLERMPQEKLDELVMFLREYGYEYELDKTVHPQTLKKYFKELLGVGLEDEEREKGIANGKFLTRADIEGVANVYQYWKTTLQAPKK